MLIWLVRVSTTSLRVANYEFYDAFLWGRWPVASACPSSAATAGLITAASLFPSRHLQPPPDKYVAWIVSSRKPLAGGSSILWLAMHKRSTRRSMPSRVNRASKGAGGEHGGKRDPWSWRNLVAPALVETSGRPSMGFNCWCNLSQVPDRLLMGPGPSNAHPAVLAAQTLPLLGHMHPPMFKIMDDIQEGLRYLFQTDSKNTLLVSGSGVLSRKAIHQCNIAKPVAIFLSGPSLQSCCHFSCACACT